MRKILCCVMCMVVLFAAGIVCYAGDIPESLLYGDNAQVYFGEIKDVEGDRVTIIQRQKIKGEFILDSEVVYQEFLFTENPVVGKQYLCGFLDDNNPVYIWEVSGFDISTLEIKNKDDMSQRMQEYLNNGDFAEQEKGRVIDESIETELSAQVGVSSEDIGGQAQAGPAVNKDNNYAGIVWLLFGCMAVGLAVLFWRRRKH